MTLKSVNTSLNLPILIFSIFLMVMGFSIVSYAAKGGGIAKPSCNKRAVAAAISPKLTSLVATSPMRLSMKADFGFYDGSVLSYIAYVIRDDTGTIISQFPSMIYSGNTENLRDHVVEGLLPGRVYSVQVIDQSVNGACVPPLAPVSIRMPALMSELIAPVVEAPRLQVYSAYIGYFYVVTGSMSDNTGVSAWKVSINGTVVREWSSDITRLSYWNQNVAVPDTKYDLGQLYEGNIPRELRGAQGALVEVEVKDALGNITKKSATLNLPMW